MLKIRKFADRNNNKISAESCQPEKERTVSSYSEVEFGSLISSNFVSIDSSCDVSKAMTSLIKQAESKDSISTIFVTDENGVFCGAIALNKLIIARKQTPLANIIQTSYPFVYDTDILEERINEIREYSVESLPILSHATNELLGVLTVSDIAELTEELFEDDYAKFASLTEDEDASEGVMQSIKKRIPWLTVLLFLSLFVSTVIGLFEQVAKELTAVIAFQSLILGMAGNAGTQSLAVTIREISNSKKQNCVKLIAKESRIGLLSGVMLGIFSFFMLGAYFCFIKDTGLTFSLFASASVSLSLAVSMFISAIMGVSIPLIFKKIKIDPAVASGPLITTINDLTAVCAFYGLCYYLLIKIFGVG